MTSFSPEEKSGISKRSCNMPYYYIDTYEIPGFLCNFILENIQLSNAVDSYLYDCLYL